MDILIKIIFLLVIISGCSQTVKSRQQQESQNQTNTETNLELVDLGSAKTTFNETILFANLAYDALVLVFASDTCITCSEEVVYWKTELSPSLPKNIYFAHFMIGGSHLDSKDWKEYQEIHWDVLYEESDSLYKKYCSKIITPCFLIVDKLNNKVVQTYQVLKRKDIEEVTGLWKY